MKQILCLDLGLIPKISHMAYANIPKSERNSKSEILLVPGVLDKGYSADVGHLIFWVVMIDFYDCDD